MKEMYNEDKFDRMIRTTLLEGGQEEVPATLWDGVLSRMAEAEKIAGRRRFFRIFASVGAALCCIATAVLLIPSNLLRESSGQDGTESCAPVAVIPSVGLASGKQDTGLDTGIQEIRHPSFLASNQAEPATAGPVISNTASASENTVTAYDEVVVIAAEPTVTDEVVAGAVPQKDDACAGEDVPVQEVAAEPVFAANLFGTNAEDVEFPEEKQLSQTRIQLSGSITGAGNTGHHSSFAGRRSTTGSLNFGKEGNITETESVFFMVPISAGVGIKIHFDDHWSIGTGINYSYLTRRLNGQYDEGSVENQYVENITNSQHYIGIPLNIYYNFAQTGRLSFYAYLDGEVQKCVSNGFSFMYAGFNKSLQKKVQGFQWNIGAGIGMQVALSDLVSLYLDPNFQYFFKSASQPKSIRTIQPFQLGCDIGLRFNL